MPGSGEDPFLEKNYTTVADTGGNWSVILPPAKAGGPY
jgi:hypothetical protein